MSARHRRHTTAQRLAVQVVEVLERLHGDRAYVLGYWNAWRAKEPLLEAVGSTWHALDAASLVALDEHQILVVHDFFEELERFALWVRCTEAMPATLERRYDAALDVLGVLGELALQALGGVPEDAPPLPHQVWDATRR